MEKAGSNAGGQANWTFMVYMAGDNNFDGAALRDIAEMARAGSTKDVNILVQLDRSLGMISLTINGGLEV
jgi:hypothetical protein